MPLEGPSPPDPRFLWLKGETLRRWEQERRATIFAERMQIGVGMTGTFGLFAWLWQQLFITGASDLVMQTSGADFSHALPALLVISLFVLIVTVSMTARDVVRR